jgi:crotonobetainyl-CoA:carnitine CoA-transferase CaiB-like acyl-CoA transferase
MNQKLNATADGENHFNGMQIGGKAVLPLAGVRILELGRLFAAPFATQILADFGADVIKVERPGRGDEFRHYSPYTVRSADGTECAESANYLAVNRNKRSITIDIKTTRGQELIHGLAKRAHVVVENYKVGALGKYRLDRDSLTAINPDLIYLSLTGFGQNGPYANRAGTDAIFQAMSGLMSITGAPDGDPQRIGIMISDMFAGFYAAISVLMSLRAREVLGAGGHHIDLALLDCTVSAVATRALDYFITGDTPGRLGPRAKGSAPSQVFTCADGLLQMQATTEADFRRLCKTLNLGHLADDPRFATRMDRYRNVEVLSDTLNNVFRTRTVHEWYELLIAADIMCSPVNTIDQTFADPQVLHRGLKVDLPRPGTKPVTVLANPIRFRGLPLGRYAPPPTLGQHTEEVLMQELGLTSTEITELKSQGVL